MTHTLSALALGSLVVYVMVMIIYYLGRFVISRTGGISKYDTAADFFMAGFVCVLFVALLVCSSIYVGSAIMSWL